MFFCFSYENNVQYSLNSAMEQNVDCCVGVIVDLYAKFPSDFYVSV